MTYQAVLLKQLTKRTGLYLVLGFRADANLGPCMTSRREVICGSAQEAIAEVSR